MKIIVSLFHLDRQLRIRNPFTGKLEAGRKSHALRDLLPASCSSPGDINLSSLRLE